MDYGHVQETTEKRQFFPRWIEHTDHSLNKLRFRMRSRKIDTVQDKS